jgi:hypothetical protein
MSTNFASFDPMRLFSVALFYGEHNPGNENLTSSHKVNIVTCRCCASLIDGCRIG